MRLSLEIFAMQIKQSLDRSCQSVLYHVTAGRKLFYDEIRQSFTWKISTLEIIDTTETKLQQMTHI